jgi:hypothetical protein
MYLDVYTCIHITSGLAEIPYNRFVCIYIYIGIYMYIHLCIWVCLYMTHVFNACICNIYVFIIISQYGNVCI